MHKSFVGGENLYEGTRIQDAAGNVSDRMFGYLASLIKNGGKCSLEYAVRCSDSQLVGVLTIRDYELGVIEVVDKKENV